MRTHAEHWSRLIVVCSALLALTVSKRIAAEDFRVPEYDIRAVVDLDMVRDALRNLEKVRYIAHAKYGGFCGDGVARIEVRHAPSFVANRWNYFFDGRVGTEISSNSYFQVSQDVTNSACDGSVGVACEFVTCPSRVTTQSRLSVVGNCKLQLYPLYPTARMDLSIALPFRSGADIPIELTQPDPDEDGFLNLEFVRFESGKWVSDGNKRLVPFSATVSSAQQITKSTNDKVLVVDGVIGDVASKTSHESLSAAVEQFELGTELPSEKKLSIRIRARALGNAGQTDPPNTGLLGHMLPVRIFGEKDVKILFWKRRMGYELLLDRASVVPIVHPKYGDSLRARLSTSYARVWFVKDPPNKGVPHGKDARGSTEVELLAGLPTVNPNSRRVEWSIKEFNVRLHTWLGLVHFKLDKTDLQNSLNEALLEIGELPEDISVSLPECIEVEKDSLISDRPCPDGVQVGKFGLHGEEFLPKLVPNYSQISSTLDPDGTISYMFPVELR